MEGLAPQDLLVLQPETIPKLEKVQNPSPQDRRISARIQARPQPTEFFRDSEIQHDQSHAPVEPSVEDSKEKLSIFSNVDDYYCRLCFKIFTTGDSRVELDNQFHEVLRELIQIGFLVSKGSRWVCSDCQSMIHTFRAFKEEIVKKQIKFEEMFAKNDHQDIEKLQVLGGGPVFEYLPEVDIKIEPEDEVDRIMIQLPRRTLKKTVRVATRTPKAEKASKNPQKFLKETQNASKKAAKKVVVIKSRPTEDIESKSKPKRSTVCRQCGKTTMNLERHKARFHGLQQLFKCGLCSFSTYDKNKWLYHDKISHLDEKGESAVCPHCAKQFTRLDEHIARVHLNERNFFCDLCPFSAYSKNSLENHMRNNHMPRTIKCPHCDYWTINNSRLKKHIFNVHKEKDLLHCTAPGCDRKFKQRSGLQFHIERKHKFAEPKFPCNFPNCKWKFHTEKEKKKHYGNSHGPKNLICDVCAAPFSSMSVLREHSKLHREFTHICTFPNCDKKYPTPAGLKRHIEVHHTEEPPYKCNECDAAYFTERYLRFHVDSKHLGLRYNCQVPGCNSTLSRRDAYVYHLKHHSDLSQDELKNYLENSKQALGPMGSEGKN